MIDKPGIFYNYDEAAYFADPMPVPSLTQSIAKTLIDYSPAHAKLEHPRLTKREPEPEPYNRVKAIGNVAHKMMLGRGREIAVAKFDDFRKKEAQAFRDEQEAAGKLVVLVDDLETAHRMVKAAHGQLEALGLFEVFDPIKNRGKGEVMIAAHDDGCWFRSLVDWLESPTAIYDFKTTGQSVAPHAVPALMASAGWPIQAAMQERILDLIEPETAGRRTFRFVAQENYEPYALTVHEITEGPLTMGRKMLAHAERIWRECMATGRWPSYPAIIHTPEYPGFKETQWLNREIADAETRERASFQPETLMAG